eukprot:scaffold211587_cov20-Tisochrysis_lutea.AAC.2
MAEVRRQIWCKELLETHDDEHYLVRKTATQGPFISQQADFSIYYKKQQQRKGNPVGFRTVAAMKMSKQT